MSNSFRIEGSELQTWHQVLAARMQVRGIAAIAKEMEAHLAKKDADGFVVVSRHQLFTWAEAIQGAASRDGSGALPAVVTDMRGILGGKSAGVPVAPAFTPPRAVDVAPSMFTGAAAPMGLYAPPVPTPSVQYTGSPALTVSASARLVTGRELGELARDLVRGARTELFVSSPWDTGLETLVSEIITLPPTVVVRIVSRMPAQDQPAFHQALEQLGRRRAVTAFSNFIQTRLIVQDGERALFGAASMPGHASREAAILLTDRASVAAVRAHFERAHTEATGGAR